MENILDVIEREFIIGQKDNELSIKDAALAVKNKEIEEKNNTIKQLTEKLQLFQSQYQDYKATCTKIIDDQRAENLELQDRFNTLRNLSRVDRDTVIELRDKLKVKDDKIKELSTKLAEVVVGNKKHGDEVEYWKDSIDRKNDYMDELHEQIEDLESIIEGQKENIADLENRINDILSIPKSETHTTFVNHGVTVVRTDYFEQLKESNLIVNLPESVDLCEAVTRGVTVVKTEYFKQLKEELEKHKKSTVENCQLRLEIEKLKDRLSSTSDKADPYKMPDYEGFRKFADEVQRKKMEEQKNRDNEKINNINRKLSIPAFKLPDDYAKGIWEAFFNE